MVGIWFDERVIVFKFGVFLEGLCYNVEYVVLILRQLRVFRHRIS